jgi:radical SAM enzyme (TIGR01210 family)
MCDLWRNTLIESVPAGAIPTQIDYALASLGTAQEPASRSASPDSGTAGAQGLASPATTRQLKLYNSGSFFDPQAIPPSDYPAIAARVAPFERVIVECHPALIGQRVLRFREILPATTMLEVAMGLETTHPRVLEKLNKRMTLNQFSRAAAFLRGHGIALRVFVLVKPPFLNEAESLCWAKKSIHFAFDCGAGVVSLIPTRIGNGALEALAEQGQFSPPKLRTLELALAYGLSLGQGRVFADLWDLKQFSNCDACFARRRERLHQANLAQTTTKLPPCAVCAED